MAAFSSRRFRTVASLLSVVLALWASLDLLAADETPSAVTDPAEFTAEQIEFFESKIRPLLIARCHECHAGETSEGSLRLDSRAALIAGGDTGPAIELAEPAASLLLETPVAYDEPDTGTAPASSA